MKTEFKNKKGELTVYGLRCGYIQEHESHPEPRGSRVTLEDSNGNGFLVRQFDFDEGKRVFWESFEKLTEARKCFNAAKKKIQAGRLNVFLKAIKIVDLDSGNYWYTLSYADCRDETDKSLCLELIRSGQKSVSMGKFVAEWF